MVKIMAEELNNTNPNGGNPDGTGGEGGNPNPQGGKTYTEEELLALIQSESDKRVSQALATQQKKFEKQLSLSKLDDEARAKAEKDERIAELEQQLAQFQVEKNRSELKSVLSSRGLSAEFADILAISDDIKASQANIDKLDKLFKAAVQAEVERRIAGNTPKGGNGSSNPMTKAELLKLPINKIQELVDSNPDFYNNLLK